MYLPSLPDIVRLLGATTAHGQLTISAYLIGFAVGQIIYGPLSDRHGRKPVLIGAIVLYCAASLPVRAVDLDRDADRRPRAAGARRLRRHRAGARHRARSLFRRARGPRIVADRRGDGAGAGGGADRRRHVADRLRLALGVRRRWRRSALPASAVVWLLLPETLARRASRAGLAFLDAHVLPHRRAQRRPISPISASPPQAMPDCSPGFRALPSCCRICTG